MKTMSDFIMEQEISNTSVDNDMEIMEGFMKVQAIGAVAECYCEHAAIADFAKEAGLNVFSESDDSLGKKMMDGVKTFFETMWRWVKALVKGVINIFTKSSLEKCIAELKAAQRDGKNTITDLDVRYLDAEKVLELVEKFGDTIQKGTALTSDTLESDFTKPAEEWLKGFKEHKKKDDWGAADSAYHYSDAKEVGGATQIERVITVLERLQKANIPSRGSKLLKKYEFKADNYKGSDNKVDKDLIKKIKKAANLLAKVYDKYCDSTVHMVRKLLKKDIKKDNLEGMEAKNEDLKKADKLGQESYAENTDGYYFL